MRVRQSRSLRLVVVATIVFSTMTALSGSANAAISSVSGGITKISPPASVLPSGICHATQMLAFDEQQGTTLASDLRVDFTSPGTYTDTIGQSTIPTGTKVDSHFLDSNRCAGGTVAREGTWKFAQDILGVIVTRGKLADSDILGAPATDYGGGYPSREFEFGNGAGADWLKIVDARTILVHTETTSVVDQMRVITKYNAPPVPHANGPYAGVEGSPVALSGTAPDPEGDPVTVSWSFTTTASPGTVCTTTGTATLTPTITCNDDALISAKLTASDPYHPAVTSITPVVIGNAPPTITSLTLPVAPVPLGTPVNLSAIFGDVGTHDTHTASIAWGDTFITGGTVAEGPHTVNGSHTYTAPGIYTVMLTVNDDNGGTVNVSQNVSVNGPPTAAAHGPYNGDEGSLIGLVGTVTDPDSTPTTTWTFTPGVADPGTACAYTGTATLTPTVKCNDNVVVAAQLTANDGINPPVVSSTNVTVDNAPPVLAPLTVTAGPIAPLQPVTVSGTFTDPGTNDTHTSTIDWGDMTTTPGTITESGGAGSVSKAHAYSAPGTYTISVDVIDDDGGIATRTTTVVINTPPTANAGGTYAGFEGDSLNLTGTASDVDGDPLTYSWGFAVVGGPGTTCSATGTATLTPILTCNDDATVTATLTVSDGINPPVNSVATVNVGNASPTAGTVVVTPGPVKVGTSVATSVPFADVGTNDTHTASINWGDATTGGSVSETLGSGTASGTHSYSAAGLYTINITVTDDDTGAVTAAASTYLVVYNPNQVTATGSGIFTSPSGAYTPDNPMDPDATGSAFYTFSALYPTPSSTTPVGTTVFNFSAPGLLFISNATAWLVVTNSNTQAYLAGTGTVGVNPYNFLVSAIDGSPDRVRVKIWDGSGVLYDNQPGAPDPTPPTESVSPTGSVTIF
jgi:hypothetical protein